jgi:hypothetical protein
MHFRLSVDVSAHKKRSARGYADAVVRVSQSLLAVLSVLSLIGALLTVHRWWLDGKSWLNLTHVLMKWRIAYAKEILIRYILVMPAVIFPLAALRLLEADLHR